MVGDARQVDAQPPGDLGIGFAGICARAHEASEIEWRQAMTLLVLGDLRVGIVGLRADDDRDGLEPGLPRGTQTLRAEEDSVATGFASGARDDRLEDAAQRDVSGQLGDLFVRELGSRVLGILLDRVDRQEKRDTISRERVERECGLSSARRRIDDLVGRFRYEARTCLRPRVVDEIELLKLRLVPWQTHGRIVPLPSAPW